MKQVETETTYEILDSKGLAGKLTVRESWVRNHVSGEADDPIPHLKLGRYVRFQWLHPELARWIERQMKNSARQGR